MADENQPDDGLTDAERKYFDTKGEVTDGLGAADAPAGGDDAPVPPTDTPAEEPAPAVSAEPAAPDAPAGDLDDDDDADPAAVDPKTGKQPPRHVNFNKFRKMRDQYKAAQGKLAERETEIAEMRTNAARLDERMSIINEALNTPAPEQTKEEAQEDPMPDPKEDIFGYIAWKDRADTRNFERLETMVKGVTQTVRQTTEADALKTNYIADAQRFAATPEGAKFGYAYQWLNKTRDNQLLALGHIDPVKRAELKEAEERSLVEDAFRNRISPAKRIYDFAVASGFNPSSVAPPAAGAAPAAAPPAAGARPAAPAVKPGQPNVGAEIDAVANGQAAAMSLSQGGGVPTETLTTEAISKMSEDDFGELMAKIGNNKEKMREYFGS